MSTFAKIIDVGTDTVLVFVNKKHSKLYHLEVRVVVGSYFHVVRVKYVHLMYALHRLSGFSFNEAKAHLEEAKKIAESI